MNADRHARPADGRGSARDTGSRCGWPIAVAVLLILGAHLVGRTGAYCSQIHADSYIYGTIGYRIAQGEVFYRDVSDIKPPALYLLYALAYLVLPAGRITMIPVDTIFGFLGYWAVYRLGCELYGRRAGLVLSVTLAAVVNYFVMMDFITDGFGLPETYMLFPAAMAVRRYRRGAARGDAASFLWCGVWLGGALMIKQTALPLAAALVTHWAAVVAVERRGWRIGLRGGAWTAGGVLLAVSPFVTLVMIQGTGARAWELLGPAAARMLSRESAWPTQWSNVLPLWVPLVWCVWGLSAWTQTRRRHGRDGLFPAARDVGFLLLWAALECAMLVFLPLRAYHYYVLSCLPFILLSGSFWTMLPRLAGRFSERAVVRCLSVAAVLSVVCGRSVPVTMVPTALGRLRRYDAEADRAFFDHVLALQINTFGAPPPAETH